MAFLRRGTVNTIESHPPMHYELGKYKHRVTVTVIPYEVNVHVLYINEYVQINNVNMSNCKQGVINCYYLAITEKPSVL